MRWKKSAIVFLSIVTALFITVYTLPANAKLGAPCRVSDECDIGEYCAFPKSSPKKSNNDAPSGIISGVSTFSVSRRNTPEFNPLCWREIDCVKLREKWLRLEPGQNSAEAKNGWVSGEKPCDQEGWGKCLPAGKTVTEISFAGKTEFAHLGDFILFIYKFAVRIAAIVATIVIIIAGIQYVTSGGNSEMITSAKKRIGGAIVGLLIAYLSYTILNTLNPALVNFRLPQVWMVREQNIVPQFCADAPVNSTFHLVANQGDQTSEVKVEEGFKYELTYSDATKDQFRCGNRYFINNAGAQTCFGNHCPNSGEKCININISGQPAPYNCFKARIMGRITNNKIGSSGCVAGAAGSAIEGLGTEGWEKPEIVDKGNTGNSGEQEIWVVCNNAEHKMFKLDSEDFLFEFPNYQFYYSKISEGAISKAVNDCGGPSSVRGFVVMQEMNEDCDGDDENHWLGYDGEASFSINQAIDLGDDGFFVVRSGFLQSDYNAMPVKGITGNGFRINKKYLVPLEKLQAGLILNIDATKVTDVDDTAVDRKVYEQLYQ